MNLCAQNFIAFLNAKGVKYDVSENESNTIVIASFQMKNTSIRVSCFMDNNNQNVALRCFDFIKVTEDKYANALLAVNQCNSKYRWVKFIIDDEMCINAQDDAVITPDTAGEETFELLARMLNIVDECYPIFMKAIWA